MSSALVWHLVRDNNSFLVKRGRTHRGGSVQFSAEPGNLLNVNTFKYSGIANHKAVHINADATSISRKNEAASNKPAKSHVTEPLSLHAGKAGRSVAEISKTYRPDLTSALTMRLKRTARDYRIRTKRSTKVLKSTRRNPKK